MGMDIGGPEWAWVAGCIFAVIGVISTVVCLALGIYWLITHVSIVLN